MLYSEEGSAAREDTGTNACGCRRWGEELTHVLAQPGGCILSSSDTTWAPN